MRSPERKYQSLWLSCLVVVLFASPLWAEVTGQITGVKLEPDNKQIVIESTGSVGEHVARVIARPNRLILDFKNTGIGRVPNRIKVVDDAIKGIRLGAKNARARMVVDFQDRPVPAFHITREANRIVLAFGKGLSTEDGSNAEAGLPKNPSTQVVSSAAPTAATPSPVASSAGGPAQAQGTPDQAKDGHGWTVGAWEGSATNAPQATVQPRRMKMAQSLEMNTPSSSLFNKRGRPGAAEGAAATDRTVVAGLPSSQGAGGQRQMVREVRPPVTPPTPDPRLLVQEITDLKFIQVGHNSRLIVQGGDHLDYRLTNVSPTKTRIDLINAEIPKQYQKPLRTDLFSTSVEMIIPGSQTIYVQLKDTVPLQVEKKKGVLMVDFPPPRFVLTQDMKDKGLGAVGKPGQGDQAAREMYQKTRDEIRQARQADAEVEIRKSIDMLRKGIESINKQQEELVRQRTEVLKRYRVTQDPAIFQKPVSMDFQGISLKNAFRLLAEQAGINIIVDDKVTGTTTVRLFQVPLGQVIDTILNSHNLDREMVNNVMRIGLSSEIKKLKEERKKEYEDRDELLRKQLEDLRAEQKTKEDELKNREKSLEKTEVEAEEPKEDVKSEDFGEAGCIKIGSKDVCFYYAQVKLIYAAPRPIVDTLKCMFNLQCSGMSENELAAQKREQFKQEQVEQGFAEGSPGFERNVTRYDQRAANIQSAQAQTATARGITEATRGGQGREGGSVGPTVELQQIIANSMVWPDEPNRMVFIKDTVERIAQMKKLIYSLDKPEPQVCIEGRMVQATKSWSRGLGVIWGGRNNQVGPVGGGLGIVNGEPVSRTAYWGMGGVQGSGTANTPTGEVTAGNNIPSSFAVNLPGSVTGMSTLVGLGMQFGLWLNQGITELDTRIQMGEHTGDAKTISRPKVTVLNKQKANMKRGTKIPYASVGAAGTQVQFINADLGLDVTPTIFADGRIRMDIKFTNNFPDYANTTDAGPPINTREANTIMTVKDGETAVIGGILVDDNGFSRNGWPGLMNVPIINYLFSNKTTNRSLDELLVFITPVIVKRPPPAS